MMRRPLSIWSISAISAALLVAGTSCATGSGKRTASTTTHASSSSATTSSTTTTTQPCPSGSTTERKTPASVAIAQMVGLTTASAAPCGDLVSFTFTSGAPVPGYDIQYKSGPFFDAGSGQPHPVTGNAFLVVRMEKAAIIDLSKPGAPMTYTGPRSLEPTGLAHVRDLEVTDAFEGVLTWVIGLDSQRPFHLATGASIPSIILTIE